MQSADLRYAALVEADFENADLTGCYVYGLSAWQLKLAGAKQSDLVITQKNEPAITVDNLEVAQFIYLLLNNQKIRNVINSITSKVVLILGRFTPERKAVLDAIREELRKQDYLPILFDFERPASRNLTETMSTLAHMARFVVADITEAESIPQELQRIVPDLPSVPIQPILHLSAREYGMFTDFLDFSTVLPLVRYEGIEDLAAKLNGKIVAPAVALAGEIARRRASIDRGMV